MVFRLYVMYEYDGTYYFAPETGLDEATLVSALFDI